MVIFAVVWLVSIGSIVSIVSISMQPGGVITSISRSNRNVAVFMVFFSFLKPLSGYFSNPFLRVKHKGGLDAYAGISAKGVYGSLALSKHCYAFPTQAAFTPDGEQYRCGSHAIRHIFPVGNIKDRGVFNNIKAGISSNVVLPQQEHCYGCALATLYINQAVESKLKEKAQEITKAKSASL